MAHEKDNSGLLFEYILTKHASCLPLRLMISFQDQITCSTDSNQQKKSK